MRRVITILTVSILTVAAMLGQDTDFSKNAESAIRKGNYVEAEKQYVAHKNTLKTIFHKSENDREFLMAEKRLGKIRECGKLKDDAESNIRNAESSIPGYEKYDVSAALANQGVYDNMQVMYQTIITRLETARRDLNAICGVFKEDAASRSSLQDVEGTIARLSSPDELLKVALFNDPTPESIENYLVRIKADDEVKDLYHSDFNAWQSCRQASDEYSAAKSYLSDAHNVLFRKNAQSIVNKHDDDEMWAKVDKESLSSVNSYLERATAYEKGHQSQAEQIKQKLEDIAADRRLWASVDKTDRKSLERYISTNVRFDKMYLSDAKMLVNQIKERDAWARVDKSSLKSIDGYLSSVKNSGYKKIGERLVDSLLWNNVNHNDWQSVYSYLNSYQEYPKPHRDEAYAEYVSLYDSSKWKATDYGDRTSLLTYLNDASNKKLSHAKEARAYIDVLDAHASWEQYRDPGKTYSLLNAAKRYVTLSPADEALYKEVGDKKSYNAFVSSKSYEAAEAYIREYPDGANSADVKKWLERYHAANAKAQDILSGTYKRTGITPSVYDYESYRHDRYVSSRSFEVSPEGYLQRVRIQKRKSIVAAGGHRFRFGFGLGGGYDTYDTKWSFTLNGELRYGNVIQNVNLVAGVNLYMYFESEESDDEFDSSSETVTECQPVVYVGPLFHIARFGSSPVSSRLYLSPTLEYDIKERGIGANLRAGITFGKTCELGVFYSKKIYDIDMNKSVINEKGHRFNVVGADLRFNF